MSAGSGEARRLRAWSFTVLPVATKYRITSVQDFLMLETTFTFLQFLIVSPLIAFTSRSGSGKAARAAAA